MKKILKDYELASGQAINLQKSQVFFCNNVSNELRDNLILHLDVCANLGSGKFLGMPSVIGRNKKSTFNYLKDRMWQKINSWSGRSLSKGGREVLIKAALQAIPAYCMSIYLIPPSLCDEIEEMRNSFW